jgi:hypothetical protein
LYLPSLPGLETLPITWPTLPSGRFAPGILLGNGSGLFFGVGSATPFLEKLPLDDSCSALGVSILGTGLALGPGLDEVDVTGGDDNDLVDAADTAFGRVGAISGVFDRLAGWNALSRLRVSKDFGRAGASVAFGRLGVSKVFGRLGISGALGRLGGENAFDGSGAFGRLGVCGRLGGAALGRLGAKDGDFGLLGGVCAFGRLGSEGSLRDLGRLTGGAGGCGLLAREDVLKRLGGRCGDLGLEVGGTFDGKRGTGGRSFTAGPLLAGRLAPMAETGKGRFSKGLKLELLEYGFWPLPPTSLQYFSS